MGGIYAANTVGAIVGALCFSLILVPWIGTQGCERVLIVLARAAARVLMLVPLVMQARSARGRAARLAAALVVAGLLSRPRGRRARHADRLRPPHHDHR